MRIKAKYSFRKASNGKDVVRVNKDGLYRWFNDFIAAVHWVKFGGPA